VYVRNFCVIRSAGKTYARTHLRVLRNSERTHVPVSFPHIARTCKCAQHETLDFLLSPRGSNAFFYVCVCTEELSSSNSPETLELRSRHPKNKRECCLTYFSNNLRALDFLRCSHPRHYYLPNPLRTILLSVRIAREAPWGFPRDAQRRLCRR
jgi:hypothetical protein